MANGAEIIFKRTKNTYITGCKNPLIWTIDEPEKVYETTLDTPEIMPTDVLNGNGSNIDCIIRDIKN